MLEIKTSMGGLEALIARLQSFDKKALEEQVGDAIVQGIREDTRNHIDYEGNTFQPYTEKYKKKRIKMGLSEEPDLWVTGTMLESLLVERKGIITVVTDTDNEGKVEGNQRYRKFMGISQRTRERIREIVNSFVGHIIRG